MMDMVRMTFSKHESWVSDEDLDQYEWRTPLRKASRLSSKTCEYNPKFKLTLAEHRVNFVTN